MDCEKGIVNPAKHRQICGSSALSSLLQPLAFWSNRRSRSILGTQQGDETDIQKPIVRQLEECPNGYPRLAAFLSSEHSFSIYRGFDYLHARVLLDLQDQIVSLERELDEKDTLDQENRRANLLQSRAKDIRDKSSKDGCRPRYEILENIRTKLVEYDEILVKARELVSFQRPSQRDHRSVGNWLWNIKPLVKKEQRFIDWKEDLITLHNGREWSIFDGMIESMLLKLNCSLVRRIFLTPELREKSTDDNVQYLDRSRIDKLSSMIITSVIFGLLVLPVVAMYKLTTIGIKSHSTFNAIGVLVVFTLLFSASMSLLTNARRHELFAASSAYCAVLVVFISNFSSVS